ncbi:MAG: nucleotidyltransferase domain-containing protein [Alteraurantiacibacter sp.]
MKAIPGLTGAERKIVTAILREQLPVSARVRVFGSRASSRWKPYSDLDLAIDLGETIPLPLQARLTESFSESDLRWKVDIVDLRNVSRSFAAIIDETGTDLDW